MFFAFNVDKYLPFFALASCLNKKELIDAIASGSKLTKADAGRLRNPEEVKNTEGIVEVTVKVKK